MILQTTRLGSPAVDGRALARHPDPKPFARGGGQPGPKEELTGAASGPRNREAGRVPHHRKTPPLSCRRSEGGCRVTRLWRRARGGGAPPGVIAAGGPSVGARVPRRRPIPGSKALGEGRPGANPSLKRSGPFPHPPREPPRGCSLGSGVLIFKQAFPRGKAPVPALLCELLIPGPDVTPART